MKTNKIVQFIIRTDIVQWYAQRYAQFINSSINTKINTMSLHELKIHACSIFFLMQRRRRMLTPIDHGFKNVRRPLAEKR